ncbi:hypothetical protein [Halocola ammonii]
MKSTLAVLAALALPLCLMPAYTFAQPGDPDLEHRLRYFNEAQDSVITYPDNLFYRWVRLDILFTPYFEVQTKPTSNLKDYLTHSNQFYQYVADTLLENYQPCHMCQFEKRKKYNPASKLGSFLLNNQNQLIADLTDLINSDINSLGLIPNGLSVFVDTPNKSDFLYKRGQFYYFTGRAEKGLKDFLAALDCSPDEELKTRIYTSIAAYYYTNEKVEQKENYHKALKYLQLAEPALEDSSYSRGELARDYLYEIEKLDLMKRYSDSTSYVNYLQNRSAGFLNRYYELMAKEEEEGSPYYTTDKVYARSREYELTIYDYLLELNPNTGVDEFKKHKKLIIGKI